MKELCQLLGIKLAATAAYHPQGDGQTERVNQELEQRQDNWVGLLLLTEFQYNNHVHSATQQPPFLLDTGQIPHMGFDPSKCQSHLESVKEHMEDALEEAKAALTTSKDDMARYYNQKWTPSPDYKPGDKIYLDASDIQISRPSKKLPH